MTLFATTHPLPTALLRLSIFSLIVCCTMWSEDIFADLQVYRLTDAKNNGRAQTSPSQWRVDDTGVSTYDFQALNNPNHPHHNDFITKPCLATFTLVGVNARPGPSTQAPIEGSENLVAVYTPEHGGNGHWDIQALGQDMTEQDIKTWMKQTITLLVRNTQGATQPSL